MLKAENLRKSFGNGRARIDVLRDLTLDIDAVDPAYAPGTGTPQVGGLTSIQILELVRALNGLNIIGCDLVEVSPPYDTGEITSLLAANLLYELLCVL